MAAVFFMFFLHCLLCWAVVLALWFCISAEVKPVGRAGNTCYRARAGE